MALRCLLTAVVWLAACSTWADDAPVEPAAATVTTASDPEVPVTIIEGAKPADPLVCKWGSAAGTRIAKKTCVRQSELDRTKQNSQNGLDTLQRKAANQAPSPNN